MTTKTNYSTRVNRYNTDTKYAFIIKDYNTGIRKPKGLGFKPNFTKKEVITNG